MSYVFEVFHISNQIAYVEREIILDKRKYLSGFEIRRIGFTKLSCIVIKVLKSFQEVTNFLLNEVVLKILGTLSLFHFHYLEFSWGRRFVLFMLSSL